MTLMDERTALVRDRWSTIVDDELTVGSLFSGFGALDHAVRDVLGGGRLAFVSDVKPAAVRLLAHRYPDVPNIGDFAQLFPAIGPLTAEAAAMPPTAVLASGWPCQPHSSAGKRLGEADPRALWPNVIRYIAEKRPALWFGENVARITTNGELRRVVRSLAGLGYVGAWRVLSASDVGAAHRRKRCFVVAVDATSDAARELVAEIAAGADGVFGERPEVGRREQLVAGSGGSGEPAREGAAGEPPAGRRATAGDVAHHDVAAPLSLLPTPTQSMTTGAGTSGREGGLNLQTAVALLPTPKASDGPKGGPNMRGSSGDLALPAVAVQQLNGAALLPTPSASRYGSNRGGSAGRVGPVRESLDTMASKGQLGTSPALVPTPRESDAGPRGGTVGFGLRNWTRDMIRDTDGALLPTPTARDGRRGAGWGDQPGRPLSETVHRIAHAVPGPVYSAAQWGVYTEALARWHAVSGLPAPSPVWTGPRGGLQLSPYFVEWLMDVEPGWVTDVPDLAPKPSGWRNACLSLLGDGVVRLQAATAYRFLLGHLAAQLATEVAA